MTNEQPAKKKPSGHAKSRVGLDIGSNLVRICEVSRTAETVSLTAAGVKRVEGSSKESLGAAVKALAEETKVSAKDAVISVSGSSVIVRFVAMPKMREEDLKGAIKFEAEKYLPFNINECVVDFQIIRKIEQENKLEILLVAAKKAYIEDRMKIAEAAGFSVSIIDVDSFAIVNSFLKNMPSLDPEKAYALLNIGAALTNLSIVRAGTVCFVRDIAMGGNEFDAAISRGLAIDLKAASELKLSPADKAPDIARCTKAVIAGILDEARLSFSYYENQHGRAVDEIYLTGGGSELTGLTEQFEETFGAKPNRWDPFQCFDKSALSADAAALDKAKNSFAVATGLALR
ncbi:MAG: type IV pilus assembly protein PilM [Candidatus Omnitrophota bacterium]